MTIIVRSGFLTVKKQIVGLVVVRAAKKIMIYLGPTITSTFAAEKFKDILL